MQQPLAFRLRPDLEAYRQRRGTQTTWVIKDPLTLEYVELQDVEYRAMRLLDGRRSVTDVLTALSKFERSTPVSVREFESFLLRLYHSGLLLRDAAGEGRRLYQEHVREGRRARAMRLFNFVAIRLRGIDPDAWLTRTLQRCPWLFSAPFVAAGVAIVLCALTLVIVEFPHLAANLPELRSFANAGSILWLALAVTLTKVLHELGHALVCKRLGGECHDMGVLFLVFAPCLYCDVSDSWTMSRRSHRMAISAAGIFVDMVTASVCTLLWWLTNPGWLHTLSLNVMLICSINTLLFNGNPFLRYDGYFLLSDLVGIPNLMQRSFATLRTGLSRLCLGIGRADRVGLEGWRTPFVVVYGLAAIAYRCLLIAAIISVFYVILTPYGLDAVAGLAAVLLVTGLFIGPLMTLTAFARSGELGTAATRLRFALTLAVGLVLAAVILFLPLGRSVPAPVVFAPAGAKELYVPQDALLLETLPAGAPVQAGDVIARLSVPGLEQRKGELQARQRTLHVEERLLETLREFDTQAAALLPTTRKKLESVDGELEQLEQQQRALTLRAPSPGHLLPPPVRRSKPAAGMLPTWTGTPLDKRNAGATLAAGTLFCLVGDPQRWEARLAIEQEAIAAVAVGQRVELKLQQQPARTLVGRVAAISPLDLAETVPDELRAWDLPFQFDASGTPVLDGTYYQALVTLEDTDQVAATLRSRGKARIHVAPETLATTIRRWFHRTFRSA